MSWEPCTTADTTAVLPSAAPRPFPECSKHGRGTHREPERIVGEPELMKGFSWDTMPPPEVSVSWERLKWREGVLMQEPACVGASSLLLPLLATRSLCPSGLARIRSAAVLPV